MKKRNNRSGQAIVEFVVGMVGVLVLTAFIIQFGSIGYKRSDAMILAREDAGRHAMSDDYNLTDPPPRFIHIWDQGPDESRYSFDDTAVTTDDGVVRDRITRHARPEDLGQYLDGNPISRVSSGGQAIREFGIVHGNETADTVPLMPVIRHLLFDGHFMDVEADVYLMWTKGIY